MVAIQYTDHGTSVRVGAAGGALARAALAAMDAPSMLDTRPWRWRIDGDRAALFADRGRWPPDDPDGRLVLLGCGAALHHAQVALAGDGAGVEVRRLPDGGEPDLVALLHYTGTAARPPRALRLHRAIALRHSDRRAPTSRPIPGTTVELLRGAAEAAGGGLWPLGPGTTRFVITAATDGPRGWLGAGETLSAVLLNATAEGLATEVERYLTGAEAGGPAWSPVGAGRPAVVVVIAPAGRVGAAEGGRP
ncbi:hypothetical protein GCM10022255_102450 [Dactylosporangium darangshiense]|uniref:Uncharacterized protein n=1 Tax=Dactylosporangium darangshiense TaxID=579108 RepID=A0ABP8DSR6_9ACTN